MSAQYSRDHCKIAVAKILQIIGWHSINSTPMEVLTDIVTKYIQQISKIMMDYTNEFGQTDANLDHLGLAFQEMGINFSELEEYVTYVNFGPGPHPAPKFPIKKESNLNFLKPGSKEVVTRPVHIPEHLPPMYPLLEDVEKEEEKAQVKQEVVEEVAVENVAVPQFKKPADVSPEFRRSKREDEGGRPTREISSVMMTTSGFLSPAREGKLPEARTPAPPPVPEPPPPPTIPTGDPNVKKKLEKRKEKFGKELFKPIPDEKINKKMPTMKDLVKMKQKTTATVAAANNLPIRNPPGAPSFPLQQSVEQKPSIPHNVQRAPMEKLEKFDKAFAAAKAKTEKLNTTITPIPPLPSSVTLQQVEKLFNEPDKKKVNIFKKISNVKDGKTKKDSRANTPSFVVEDHCDIVNKISLSSDITIEPIHPVSTQLQKGSHKLSEFYDDASPPTTPSMPRTPEIMTPSPTVQKVKRKRKDTCKVKRVRKNHQPFMGAELIDLASIGRPKTPDTLLSMAPRHQLPHMGMPGLPFPFLTGFTGPGLIPPQMFPLSHLGPFGEYPNFPPVVHNMPPQVEPVSLVSPKMKETIEIKPVEATPKPSPKQQQQPIQVPEASSSTTSTPPVQHPVQSKDVTHSTEEIKDKKIKEHKKEKKDKIKKKNKKDKIKEKSEKKKLKELKKDNKDKIKREKKVKKKEKLDKETGSPIPKILLKVNSPSPRPETPESIRKLNIKPIIKKDEETVEETRRDTSPSGLAKISALVTGPPKPKSTLSPVIPAPVERVPEESSPVPVPRPPGRPRLHPVKPKPPKPKKVEQTFKKIDEQGNEVWICPACGQQDDGRAMIGCDGCDAWYHWVCVGIQVPPDENENWYCKPCLCKKNEDLQSDKKRKRKRKEKKEH